MNEPKALPELKACPFCGGESGFCSGERFVFINCIECLIDNSYVAEMQVFDKEDAINHWNNRPKDVQSLGENGLVELDSTKAIEQTRRMCFRNDWFLEDAEREKVYAVVFMLCEKFGTKALSESAPVSEEEIIEIMKNNFDTRKDGWGFRDIARAIRERLRK